MIPSHDNVTLKKSLILNITFTHKIFNKFDDSIDKRKIKR